MSSYLSKEDIKRRGEELKKNISTAPKKCPHCGHKIFKYKASARGHGSALFNAETGEVDYSDIIGRLIFTPGTKFLYCANCSKRIV